MDEENIKRKSQPIASRQSLPLQSGHLVSFIDSLCLASQYPISQFIARFHSTDDQPATRCCTKCKAETKSSEDRTGRQQPIDPLLKAKQMRFHCAKIIWFLFPSPVFHSSMKVKNRPRSIIYSQYLVFSPSFVPELCCARRCPYDWIASIERNWIQTGFHPPTSFHVFWVSHSTLLRKSSRDYNCNWTRCWCSVATCQLGAAAAWCSMEMELDFRGVVELEEKTGGNR